MRPTHANAFAVGDSNLGTFLYADVGTELNGSALTILSVVARLGKDPWEEAARWARLPKAVVIDSLAQDIAQMPLAPSALAEIRATAARLALLLPAQAQCMRQAKVEPTSQSVMPGQCYVVILLCALIAGMALNLSLTSKAPGPAVAPARKGAGAEAPGHGASFDVTGASAKRVTGGAGASPSNVPALR